MQTIIANFSHVDVSVFHKEKSLYSYTHMMTCLKNKSADTKSKEGEYYIAKDVRGKPWAYKKNDIKTVNPFSVTTSHSYPYVYSGSATEDILIGCDVERIRNFEDFFLFSFLHPNEIPFVGTADMLLRKTVATMIWAIKESILKALGSGLRTHPKRIDISSILLVRKKGIYTVTLDGKSIVCNVTFLNEADGFMFCFLSLRKEALKRGK